MEKGTRTLFLDGVTGHVALIDVNHTVNVERNLLAVGTPVLVAEAVRVLAILLGCEGVVAGRHGLVVELITVRGVDDLYPCMSAH